MHSLMHISPTSSIVTDATAMVYTDINSVLCTRHMAAYCWTWKKHDKKHIKWLAVGANAANDWGWS